MLKILKNKQENIEEEEIFIHQPLTDQGPQRWQQKHCGAREAIEAARERLPAGAEGQK